MTQDISMTSNEQISSVVTYSESMLPADGMRLYVCRWKETKKADGTKQAAKQSVAVQVPQARLGEVKPVVLADALNDALLELQDGLLRKLIEDGKIAIKWSDVDFEAIAAYAASVSQSKKLSKAVIASWFDASIADKLLVALHAAFGLPQDLNDVQARKLMLAVDQHKQEFLKLAAPSPAIAVKTATSLMRAVSKLVEDDDSIGQVVKQKLEPLTVERSLEFYGI